MVPQGKAGREEFQQYIYLRNPMHSRTSKNTDELDTTENELGHQATRKNLETRLSGKVEIICQLLRDYSPPPPPKTLNARRLPNKIWIWFVGVGFRKSQLHLGKQIYIDLIYLCYETDRLNKTQIRYSSCFINHQNREQQMQGPSIWSM